MTLREHDRIRADLERLGIGSELSGPLAQRLAPITRDLSGEAYEAMLSGVSLAFGVRGGALEGLRQTTQDLDEIHHLLNAFTDELRKLDEALETLAAYALRLKTQGAGGRGALH